MKKLALLILPFLFFLFLYPNQALATDPLAGITIEPEDNATLPFERVPQYGDWIDADGDGEDTRLEVLKEESYYNIETVILEDGKKHILGLWFDPYTGKIFTDAKDLDIDHMVPLKETHVSGGYKWDQAKREAYANELSDPQHLIAVMNSSNRSKSFRDPDSWLPPNRSYWCQYLNDWIDVKRRWGLSMDQEEADTVRKGLKICDRYRIGDKFNGKH